MLLFKQLQGSTMKTLCVCVCACKRLCSPTRVHPHTYTHTLSHTEWQTVAWCASVCVFIRCWSAPESFWVFASPECRTRCWTLDLCSPQSPSCTSPAGRGNETLHIKGTVTLWKRLCGSLSDRTRSIFDVLPYLARPRLSRCCTKTNTSSPSAVEYFHAYACYFQCTSVFTDKATWRAQRGWTWNAGATLLSLNRTEESWKPLNYFQPAGGLH